MIQKIKILKELFVLDLEQGIEVHIPKILSQQSLPYSFRYYDPVIQMVQSIVSEQKTKLLGIQTSLIRHFEKKYDENMGFGFNKKQNKNKEENFKFSIKG
jgi:hypothetical protein